MTFYGFGCTSSSNSVNMPSTELRCHSNGKQHPADWVASSYGETQRPGFAVTLVNEQRILVFLSNTFVVKLNTLLLLMFQAKCEIKYSF